MRDRCETCRFFDRSNRSDIADCRRFPPRVVGALLEDQRSGSDFDELFYATVYPVVLAVSWCGEYRRAESASGVPIVPGSASAEVVLLEEGQLPPVLQRAIDRCRGEA